MKKMILVFLLVTGTLFAPAQNKKVLFVMSAAKELPLRNGKVYSNTGVFLSEFYLAYKDIAAAGYEIDLATPGGVVSSIDKESYDKKYWKGRDSLIDEGIAFTKNDAKYNAPMTLEQALRQTNDYAGLVVPGGEGLMVDLIRDSTMKRILHAFAVQEKCVGLICHAPALLTMFAKAENPYAGYKVNSVTGLEERFIELFIMNGKPVNRKIGKQLRRSGLRYMRGGPRKNYAVRDRFLVTSQNPFSNQAFNKYYLEALRDYQSGHVAR